MTAGAVLDVEDEIARAVGPVTDERTARRTVVVGGDTRAVDAVPRQTVDIDAAEIVVANG